MSYAQGKPFMSVAEAAEFTGQSQQEILYQINSGKLPAVYEHASDTYRINEMDLEAFKISQPQPKHS